MNLGKKIFLLCLLLVVLMVFCVYKYTKEFMVTKPHKIDIKNSVSTLEKKDVKPLLKKEKPIKSDAISPKENIKIKKIVKELKPLNILKRFDDGYSRSNKEVVYSKLSPKSKAIQDKLYLIMKNEPFKFGKNKITYLKINDKILEKIIKIMKTNPNLKFEIAGHFNIKGNDDKHNKYISIMRAANIKKRLISMGISKKRMKGRGYGDKIPLIQGDIKLLNRIEFNIIGE